MDEPRLTIDDFATFFRQVHDCEPFPWQKRLTARVLSEGRWPAVIDLPTGTGKTAVLDTAVFSLAAMPTTFPRRMVFVIDRRIVVDQVCERARCIAEALEGGTTPLLKAMRDRLRRLSDGGKALGVAALRGGIPIDNGWSRQPDEPWVLVSTVDQFGSRLLFRGYSVGPRMRPIHAGLAGNDCLVLLDEVHLSVPFAETLRQVGEFEPQNQLPRRFQVVEMSATPARKDAPRFRLDPDADLAGCEELARRVHAPKEAQLMPVLNHKAMPARIVKLVKSLTVPKVVGNVSTVGVVVNRVRTARETYVALKDAGYTVHLLTGRMRALDRLDVLQAIGPAVNPDRESGESGTTVLVATQAIEVGADFSFDALITECAPVDSLRQRFGRLDRRGTYYERAGTPAQAVILGPKSVVGVKKPDPIYGDAVKVTWTELANRADDGRVDVGPLALSDYPETAVAPRDKAPLVLHTHMDAWVQTNPAPLVEPRIDWFLHGMERSISPEVSFVWRRDTSAEVLRHVPPRQLEYLQVPLGAARAWLRGDAEADIGDVPFEDDEESAGLVSDSRRKCLRWEGMGKEPASISADNIRPGDVLVVEASRGGIEAGTWSPASEVPVADLGDRAQFEFEYRRRAVLRLDGEMFGTDGLPAPPAPTDEVEADKSARQRIEEWLRNLELRSDWLSRVATTLLEDGFGIVPIGGSTDSDSQYYVLIQQHVGQKRAAVDSETMDGSDDANSHQGTGTTLQSHLDGVAQRAYRFAQSLRLPAELAEDLRLAGQLHDIGKVDQRFQEQLVGGDVVELAMLDEPLAKSRPGTARVHRYPRGMRHEVGSLALVLSNRAVLDDAHDPELVLFLIGSHHGYGRSLVRVLRDSVPQQLSIRQNSHLMTCDSDVSDTSLTVDMADSFWRLVKRYGYYGLAWMETILRLADHRESEAAS